MRLFGLYNEKLKKFIGLHDFHYGQCAEYRNLVDNIFPHRVVSSLETLPFLPSTIFKNLELRSIPKDDIYKTMMSSGTTGQARSKIYINKENAKSQQNALLGIAASKLGQARLPMLILDTEFQIKNRASFTARGAGILGFMIFGKPRLFALDKDMALDIESIEKFSEIDAEKKFMYGFTSIIWEEVLEKLEPGAEVFGSQHAVLIHGGGWKKLSDQKISSTAFNSSIKSKLGRKVEVIDYYGMVEQTGSIFLENQKGFLETNEYNDVVIRDPFSLMPVKDGEMGLVQVLSTLPVSYPGFSILTEDMGRIVPASRHMRTQDIKSFEIKGRMPKAELRGCSNTYE